LQHFKQEWKKADLALKHEMVRLAGQWNLEQGLEPVMIGLKDYVRSVREEAKEAFERLSYQAVLPPEGSGVLNEEIIKRSGRFSAVVYREMSDTKALNLIETFILTLLRVGGRGPKLAWHFFSRNIISENIMLEMIKKFPEELQLIFIHQYTLNRVLVRRQYVGAMKMLLEQISDSNAVVIFLAYLFDHDAYLDPFFADCFKRLEIERFILENIPISDNRAHKIKAMKAALVLGGPPVRDFILSLLSSDEKSAVRIECLKLIAKSSMATDAGILQALYTLLDDPEDHVVLCALEAMAALKSPDTGQVAAGLYRDRPSLREKIHSALIHFEWAEKTAFFADLQAHEANAARSAVAHEIFKKNPEKMICFLEQYKKSTNSNIKVEAEKLLKQAQSIKKQKPEDIGGMVLPKHFQRRTAKKGLVQRIAEKRRRKDLKKRLSRNVIAREVFCAEVLSGFDLSGTHFMNVNFSGAILSNVNFSSAKLESVSFAGAYLEDVNFENASLDAISFENAFLHRITASNTTLNKCDFTKSNISEADFDGANLQAAVFADAQIAETNFSHTDLSASCFLNAVLFKTSFKSACLDYSDFSLVKATRCDYSGTDLLTVTALEADLNSPDQRLRRMSIPAIFFANDVTQINGFRSLMLNEEMEKTHSAFMNYNNKRIELAMDTFSAEQADLFELIPLLIHTDLELIPKSNPIRNAPAGIFGYQPSFKALQLLNKYFDIPGSALMREHNPKIEGLYTIGSAGTVAQSTDSDIDYWLCVDNAKLDDMQTKLLKAKLAAIEKWADETFNTELHFFVVDPSAVRKDRFGASDLESSGSAQGKILKEEFYRTMILVGGRLPLWCAVPSWTNGKYYRYLMKVASQFHKDYLDLGDVSSIPRGEYFGACIWQLLKSLKSPYKSVMKMALLEKYMQQDEDTGLLCKRLKSLWAFEKHHLEQMDPYLVLFEEVMEYYQSKKHEPAIALLKLCFFLKLGIRWIKDLDASVLPIRKNVVQYYLDRWNWDAAKVQDLGSFREWPFEKIFMLSNRINQFMLGTYEKLSRSLQESTGGTILITPEDLTILGRKMFVQFSKSPYKVEKLPLIAHGKHLFKQLHLQYAANGNATGRWQLVHLKRQKQKSQVSYEILKELERIEEIAIWLVRNDLFTSTASLKLMPNPSPVTYQELVDLVKSLHDFFPPKETEQISPQALLEKPFILKLFLAVNFSLDRRLNKIHEYTAIYMTSWGEFFCRTFHDKDGICFLEDVITAARWHLGLSFPNEVVGFYVPQSLQKRLGTKER